ncbi:hypothetical protein E2C01_064453 [Portunus trituberculatus]|uniref:Uncharacterized protein n=1 Tax=Portunus trituberculatus TaxID=210409 RepID=A0A5B7HBW1_PORTR|nr:hypothetical protein [Portunus trituberculatus]
MLHERRRHYHHHHHHQYSCVYREGSFNAYPNNASRDITAPPPTQHYSQHHYHTDSHYRIPPKNTPEIST